QQSDSIKEVFVTLGMSAVEMQTLNYKSFISIISRSDIQKRLTDIENYKPFLFNSIKEILSKAKESINLQSITELPPITTDQYVSSEEEIHSSKLLSSWPELKQFLGSKGIRVSAIQAVA
ncbi:hypothetical protein, partial [Lelliottia nimipressuralis]|uniref:hypothetical protein n=1 Tax=Lelliottia nimipressuralis TaxID=69220 RepID=UPI001E49A6C1